LTDVAVRPTVEQILENIPDSGIKEMLAKAGRRQHQMNAALDDVANDDDLNPEGKQRRAQQVIDRHAHDIAHTYQEARSGVESRGQKSYEFSLPFPEGRPSPPPASRRRPRSWRCRAGQTTLRRG
jgi:hypothetical protein